MRVLVVAVADLRQVTYFPRLGSAGWVLVLSGDLRLWGEVGSCAIAFWFFTPTSAPVSSLFLNQATVVSVALRLCELHFRRKQIVLRSYT